MKYVTNPIRLAKQKLAFRGIVIKENLRCAKELKAITELEKTFKQIGEVRNAQGQQVSFKL